MVMEASSSRNNSLVVGADGSIYRIVTSPVFDVNSGRVEHGNLLTRAQHGHPFAIPHASARARTFGGGAVEVGCPMLGLGTISGRAASLMGTPLNVTSPVQAATSATARAPFLGALDGTSLIRHSGFQPAVGIGPDVANSTIRNIPLNPAIILNPSAMALSPLNHHGGNIAVSTSAMTYGGGLASLSYFPRTLLSGGSQVPSIAGRRRPLVTDQEDELGSGESIPNKRVRLTQDNTNVPGLHQFGDGGRRRGGVAVAPSAVPSLSTATSTTLPSPSGGSPHPRGMLRNGGLPTMLNTRITGRSYRLFAYGDDQNLSQYQCLSRKQIEIFEATEADAQANAQGRNKPIQPGQVGIRCRHCCKLPPKERKTGAVYYPNRLDGLYQTAQKMTVGHLIRHCTMIPEDIREKITFLKDQKSSDGGGKRYWAERVRALGVIETAKDGLAFSESESIGPAAYPMARTAQPQYP